jgi:hypothetical protein
MAPRDLPLPAATRASGPSPQRKSRSRSPHAPRLPGIRPGGAAAAGPARYARRHRCRKPNHCPARPGPYETADLTRTAWPASQYEAIPLTGTPSTGPGTLDGLLTISAKESGPCLTRRPACSPATGRALPRAAGRPASEKSQAQRLSEPESGFRRNAAEAVLAPWAEARPAAV